MPGGCNSAKWPNPQAPERFSPAKIHKLCNQTNKRQPNYRIIMNSKLLLNFLQALFSICFTAFSVFTSVRYLFAKEFVGFLGMLILAGIGYFLMFLSSREDFTTTLQEIHKNKKGKKINLYAPRNP